MRMGQDNESGKVLVVAGSLTCMVGVLLLFTQAPAVGVWVLLVGFPVTVIGRLMGSN